mmetsp:Transcript_39500/g.130757  ORF Transcript_39500/g.130757 Transcript_39500/m.130757 type:complete len:276 (-) Transcript_39500:1296-2123(-)
MQATLCRRRSSLHFSHNSRWTSPRPDARRRSCTRGWRLHCTARSLGIPRVCLARSIATSPPPPIATSASSSSLSHFEVRARASRPTRTGRSCVVCAFTTASTRSGWCPPRGAWGATPRTAGQRGSRSAEARRAKGCSATRLGRRRRRRRPSSKQQVTTRKIRLRRRREGVSAKAGGTRWWALRLPRPSWSRKLRLGVRGRSHHRRMRRGFHRPKGRRREVSRRSGATRADTSSTISSQRLQLCAMQTQPLRCSGSGCCARADSASCAGRLHARRS